MGGRLGYNSSDHAQINNKEICEYARYGTGRIGTNVLIYLSNRRFYTCGYTQAQVQDFQPGDAFLLKRQLDFLIICILDLLPRQKVAHESS